MGHDDDPIELVPYDPSWPRGFEVARDGIASVLGSMVVDIEHIGSTAVPGLAAKPVLDILVGVRTLDDSPAIITAIRGLGYEYVPDFEIDTPFRRYFRCVAGGVRTHQIHLVERTNTAWWDRHVDFRDWLRTDDEDRDAYAALKTHLAVEHRHDRLAYTEAKTPFIAAVQARATPT